ncbi:MAG: hypothetical protein U0Q16_38770 [Bryobacteraceae bacterium]
MKTFLAFSVVSILAAAEPVRRINSQPSWIVENDQVELAITQLGGHMAPVKFQRRDAQPVQPYHISPWQDENLKINDPVLVPLRGDFFCLPFGGGREPNGREHPAHGETATSRWTFGGIDKQGDVTALTLTLETKVRPGKVTKRVMLVDGQNVVYTQHRVEGFAGKSTPGHHATLRLPEKEGAFRIASSAFAYGTTHPLAFADISQGEYQSFAVGAEIKDLRHVPSRFKDAKDIDMTALPTERGYVNLMAIFKRSGAEPGWMAAVNQQDGYVWFSLKDAAVLPATVFWLENRGRHGAPWSGRNRCLGMEDVCWYFDKSHEANPVNRMGIPTTMQFDGAKPASINYIQGAVKAPAGFDQVKTIEFAPGQMTLVSMSGKRVTVAVRHEFLKTGELKR